MSFSHTRRLSARYVRSRTDATTCVSLDDSSECVGRVESAERLTPGVVLARSNSWIKPATDLLDNLRCATGFRGDETPRSFGVVRGRPAVANGAHDRFGRIRAESRVRPDAQRIIDRRERQPQSNERRDGEYLLVVESD